jgi:arsenate reductase
MRKQCVLFLCTGDSARGQMAEGLVNHYLGEQWEAYSAGTRPAWRVHPLAVEAMAELDVDLARHWSKPVGALRRDTFDLVITVCDDAAESCPVWLGRERSVHIGFPDPAQAAGTREEKLAVFRQVRDDIKRDVFALLAEESVA